MKEINVDSHSVPSTARSKNYRTAQVTTTSSGGGGGATSPSVAPTTGGAADTSKVAQNLAEDSTDWTKIMRKDQDERTENSLSIGKDITVDGKAILNDVVANTGTFAGPLKAASATITGALLASTVSATTINATTFIGELQGNAATATKLKTARTIWGQSFDGSRKIDWTITCNTRYNANNGLGLQLSGSSTNFTLHEVSGNNWGIGYNNNINGTPTTVIDFLSNGNVGIDTTSPSYKLDVNGNARIASDLYADATVGTRNFASRTTGWRADSNGNADFRNIYADELRVQAFTADISQALAGSDYLTKSVSKLSANFVVPAVNGTVRIIVDDIEGMPATQCFSNNDYIRFRAFNRTSGLTIANVWGTVVLDTTYGSNGFTNGTQAYTFTCKATSGAGLTVFKGSEVLDYGTSGSGMISRTTLDAQGSPYEQIATWVNDPSVSTNYTVHARLGNLGGIANCNGYGLYTDNGFFTGKIIIGDLTKNNNFLSFDGVNGLRIKLGGTSVATTNDVSNSLSTANSNAQGYASTAQSNAISTASSDATTKANSAYTNAVSYTDTQITATNNSISSKVSQTTFDALGTRVSTAESTITQHTTDIGLRVTKDGVIGAINLTSEAATIAASKINLVGAVTFGSLDSSVQKTINGKKDVIYNIVVGDGVTVGTFLIATFTITGGYVDRPIKLSAHERGGTPSNLYIRFSNTDSIDPALDSFKKDGAMQFYMVKVATSTWNLYAGQSEGIYSDVYITDFYNPQSSSIATTWKTDIVTSLPAGYITATQMIGTAEWCYNNNISYIDGAHVYTGTLDAVSIVAGSITGDRIAGNTITGDKIVANSITGDKLVINTITALGNVTAGSFNIGSGKFVVDANGNMTAINATISGTLNGVSGTFNYLQGVGSNGKFWFNNTAGSMSIEDEDFRQQGIKNNRSLRFYASDIRCRGSFGASSLNMARVHDTYIDYYVNGDTNSFVRFDLQSNGVGGYYIPLFPISDTGYRISSGNASLGDVFGFPVDVLIFDNRGTYQYEMIAGACGKKVIVVNANDCITVHLAINGNVNWTLEGGVVHTFINIREFTNPLISSSVHGAGWMMCGGIDNNWA